ncbi:cysteine--tRNA ligase [Candidatus Woesearchaeota archaeon]|nr:cysteine--tRNA ligase [Candidatus Woesearchaeota archaeon]
MMIKSERILLRNTLGGKLEVFIPLNPNEVTMYTCGPTVYARAHIGNMRAYIFADILRRTLEYAGYKVKQVMNITDVGHLTSDADEGEDKLQKSAKEQRTTAWEISKKYTELFLKDISNLNIQRPSILCKATDHIQEQIELVKILEQKGFTYITSDGVYYDTSKFPKYGELAKLNIDGLKAGYRIDMGEKRNKTDFALWKFSKPNEKRDMEWNSPWGRGFPGWHIECSAMSMKYLGETFDVHTGGIDHIPVHHTNEIAQSEAATGKKFVNYWLHSNFLVISKNEKMSKSLGNIVDLDTLINEGYDPLAYRYLCLNTHYRKQLIYGKSFLDSASNSYNLLKDKIKELDKSAKQVENLEKLGDKFKIYLKNFKSAVFNDLNTPRGIAVMWGVLKDKELTSEEKYYLICDFDKIFALNLSKIRYENNIPQDIKELALRREKFRKNKQWVEADKLREEIISKGYSIKDTSNGYVIEKI